MEVKLTEEEKTNFALLNADLSVAWSANFCELVGKPKEEEPKKKRGKRRKDDHMKEKEEPKEKKKEEKSDGPLPANLC